MAEYLVIGTIKLAGVMFTIEAENLDEAKAKAAAGEYIEWEIDGSEAVDWKLNPTTVQENK